MTTGWLDRPEGGSARAIRLLILATRVLGRSVSRLALIPITVYFLVRRGPERRASRGYLARALGRSPTIIDVARHFFYFASVTLDRIFMLTGQLEKFDINLVGLEGIHAAMSRGKGVLLVGAHAGSFDALRAISQRYNDVSCKVILDVEHSPVLSRILNSLNPELARSIINPRQNPTRVVLEIAQALHDGALVTMLGDRARPGNATISVRFLGAEADFPAAPWQIAAALHVPVVLVIGLYRGGNRYDLHFVDLFDEIRAERHQRPEQIRSAAQRFADHLEELVQQEPYNWFNFYEFWKDSGAGTRIAGNCDVDGLRNH